MAFKVDEELTATGPLYRLPMDDVGVDPSVVYRIDAPPVVVVIVTDNAEANVPPGGLKTGAATCGRLMVYAAELMALSIIPVPYAIAFSVVVLETATGAL
jgi:hypothetical protein